MLICFKFADGPHMGHPSELWTVRTTWAKFAINTLHKLPQNPLKKTSTEKILKSQVLFCYLQVYLEYLRMRSSYLVYMIKRLGNGTVTE